MSGSTQETFKINCLDARWNLVLDVDALHGTAKETYLCTPSKHTATVTPSEVIAMRLITQEERDEPLGIKEKDSGVSAIHPHATSVITTKSGNLYTPENVVEAINQLLTETPATVDPRDFSQTAKLILAVAKTNPEALPPLTGGWKISRPVSGYTPA